MSWLDDRDREESVRRLERQIRDARYESDRAREDADRTASQARRAAAGLREELAGFADQIGYLEAENRDLRERIAELEAAVGKVGSNPEQGKAESGSLEGPPAVQGMAVTAAEEKTKENDGK